MTIPAPTESPSCLMPPPTLTSASPSTQTTTPAVVTTTSGSTSDAARSHLYDLGFPSIGPDTMVLAHIDHKEPYYANTAAKQLSRYRFTVEIETALQEKIDTERTWGNHPFPWCTRDEVREVSAEAQRSHNDIAEGRLVVRNRGSWGRWRPPPPRPRSIRRKAPPRTRMPSRISRTARSARSGEGPSAGSPGPTPPQHTTAETGPARAPRPSPSATGPPGHQCRGVPAPSRPS